MTPRTLDEFFACMTPESTLVIIEIDEPNMSKLSYNSDGPLRSIRRRVPLRFVCIEGLGTEYYKLVFATQESIPGRRRRKQLGVYVSITTRFYTIGPNEEHPNQLWLAVRSGEIKPMWVMEIVKQ